jgi:hypothetical protein
MEFNNPILPANSTTTTWKSASIRVHPRLKINQNRGYLHTKNGKFENLFYSFSLIELRESGIENQEPFSHQMRRFALLRGRVFLWKRAEVYPVLSEVERLVGLITKSEGILPAVAVTVEAGPRTRQRPFTEARFERRPCRRTHPDQTLCVTCAISVKKSVSICVNPCLISLRALGSLWLKPDQSKHINYAKQSQFSESQKWI